MKILIKFSLCLAILFVIACNNEKASTKQSQIGTTGNPDIDRLTQLITANPSSDSLYAARAKLFYENRAYDEAVADMASAMKIDSNNVLHHHLLADIYMNFTKSRLALNTMERAAQLYPERIPTLLKLAEFQLILRMNNESMKTIDQILRLEPNNADAYYMIGMNFKEMGDTARAINSFQKSFENDDQKIDACINLGLLWERKNNPLALKYYDAALRLDSTSIAALYAKAMYYQNRYQDDKAIAIYRQINSIDSHNTDAFFNTGILYYEKDSLKKAYEHFNIVVNEDPLHLTGYYYRGLVNEKLGNKKEAIADYKQALGLSPSYTEAKEALARLGI